MHRRILSRAPRFALFEGSAAQNRTRTGSPSLIQNCVDSLARRPRKRALHVSSTQRNGWDRRSTSPNHGL